KPLNESPYSKTTKKTTPIVIPIIEPPKVSPTVKPVTTEPIVRKIKKRAIKKDNYNFFSGLQIRVNKEKVIVSSGFFKISIEKVLIFIVVVVLLTLLVIGLLKVIKN